MPDTKGLFQAERPGVPADSYFVIQAVAMFLCHCTRDMYCTTRTHELKDTCGNDFLTRPRPCSQRKDVNAIMIPAESAHFVSWDATRVSTSC